MPEAAFHFGQGLLSASNLRQINLKRMKIDCPVIAQLAKGFSAHLTHINLDNNKMSTEGLAAFRRQIAAGQGGDYVNPLRTSEVIQGKFKPSRLPWNIQFLSLKSNEATETAFEHISFIAQELK